MIRPAMASLDDFKTSLAIRTPQSALRNGLRVCHIMTADMWAGAEVQVAAVARQLAGSGEVELSAMLFNDGWLARELGCLGIDLAVFDEQRHPAIRLVRLMVHFLREHRVDLVHTHRYKDTILGAIAAKLAGGLPVVRTVHGLNEEMRGWDRVKLSAYQSLERAVVRGLVDRVVAVSDDTAARLRRSWLPAAHVTAIENGVDCRTIRPAIASEEVRRILGIGRTDLVIGTAGRLVSVKGHVYLLRAARRIRTEEPSARLVIVGTGPLRQSLSDEAARLGIADACVFVDPAADRRAGIYDLIAAMDIFVLPSLDEGLPMSLLEAMALGRPVVAAAVGGVPEIVEHRTTGLLISAKDDREIAVACVSLAFDRHWARTLAEKGRAVVEERFSCDRQGRALLDVYRGAARSRPIGTYGYGRIDAVRNKLTRARERARMARIRRNPSVLRSRVARAKTILIVCHGNIIRSPFAAELLRQTLRDVARVSVTSAGVQATAGAGADPAAIAAAMALGVDLGSHAAAPLTSALASNADVIFVMDAFQLVAMRKRFPQICDRVFLMTSLCSSGPLEIRDPFGGNASQFQECFADIARAVQKVAEAVSQEQR
jgi:L-malate glycosyltransferase